MYIYIILGYTKGDRYKPGTIATVLRARRTLNVLKAARFPRSIPIVT